MENENIYDPTDKQLEALGNFPVMALDFTAPVDPQIVNLIIQQNRISLYELKVSKSDVNSLREIINQQKDIIENLRIKLAESKSNDILSWAEIFISLLGVFAINRLTTSFDIIGLVTLIFCVVILVIFRSSKISLILNKKTEK